MSNYWGTDGAPGGMLARTPAGGLVYTHAPRHWWRLPECSTASTARLWRLASADTAAVRDVYGRLGVSVCARLWTKAGPATLIVSVAA